MVQTGQTGSTGRDRRRAMDGRALTRWGGHGHVIHQQQELPSNKYILDSKEIQRKSYQNKRKVL